MLDRASSGAVPRAYPDGYSIGADLGAGIPSAARLRASCTSPGSPFEGHRSG